MSSEMMAAMSRAAGKSRLITPAGTRSAGWRDGG